jgi:hypothetical protein
MTKYCFRFLFLALAGLPLAHGCSDSSIECLGTAVACSNRDTGECNHGCRLRTGCVGDLIVSCESLTDNPNLCLQTSGCRYVGSCDGAEGCRDLDYAACPMMEGCMQVRRCIGDGVRCNSLDESQCELYSQCTLGNECLGSATQCDELDSSSACLDVPGCFTADTKPSVVASAGLNR